MKGPGYIIDEPSPFEPPEVWWGFLEHLNGYDHNDPAVAHSFETAVRHLRTVMVTPENQGRLRNARQKLRVVD